VSSQIQNKRRRSRDISLVIIGATSLFSLGGCSKAPPDMKQSIYASKQDCLMHWGHVQNACQPAEGEYKRKDYYVGPQFDANGKEKPKDSNGIIATVAPALIAGAAVAAGAAAMAAAQNPGPTSSSSTTGAAFVSRSGTSTASSAAPAASSSAHGGFGSTASAHSSGG
jgi:hypothetical protein